MEHQTLLASSPLPATRRERAYRSNLQLLLGAAQALFARKSFDSVTVEEIAEAAAFGNGTVYNYFPNGKEALLQSLFDRLRRDLCTLTETMAVPMRADCSSRRALQTYYAAVLGYFQTHPEQFGLLVRQGHHDVRNRWGEPSTLFAELHEDLIAALEPALEQLDMGTDMASLSPRLAAGFVLGSLYTYLFTEAYNPADAPSLLDLTVTPDAAAVLLTTVLLDGLGQSAPVPV